MRPQPDTRATRADQTAARATLLAAAMTDTAAELRLVDPADMIDYIRAGKWAEVADLVQSSSELSLVEGSLSFACAATVAVDWTRPLRISLELEFTHADVAAFFTLHLSRHEDVVELKTIWFAAQPTSEADATRRFAAAVGAARLPLSRGTGR